MIAATSRAALLLFALLAIGTFGSCANTPPTTLDEALDLIREQPLRSHYRWLADDERDGRAPGEPGYDVSAEYVIEQFALMGLQPAGTDGWFQHVPLRSYEAIGDTAEFIIHGADGDIAFTYRDDFGVFGDPVALSTRVRAEVVYVGYGVHAPELGYSDYEGIDVRGKIIAVYSGTPEHFEGVQRAYYRSSTNKRREAVARGAVGTITLRSRKAEQRSSWDEIKGRIGRRALMTWVDFAGEAARHFPELRGGVSLSPRAAEILFTDTPLSYEDTLTAMEAAEVRSAPLGVEVSIARESVHRDLSSPNIVGLVRGTDPELADEYVIYTAHLDHLGAREVDGVRKIYNGAYDNAMGVALMLETARVFAALPPRRSVLFVAVTGEERGLLGSDYFVNNPVVPIDSIVANINLDMPLFLYPVADLVTFGSEGSSLQAVAAKAAAVEGFVFSQDPLPEETRFIRSDQYSFIRAGVPAIYLVPGFKSKDEEIDGASLYRAFLDRHYHEATDDLQQPVHWGSALRFARAHARLGYAVASDRQRPTWDRGSFLGERFAPP
ncbi:MAG: M28 family metallopeptidase [Woeseiaceae bacterium]|nr:M28 family metallopeptidase [Woeseiaceae bacterium]